MVKATVVFYNDSGKSICKSLRADVFWSTGMNPANRRTVSIDFDVPENLRRPYHVSVYLSVPGLMRLLWGRVLEGFDKEVKP